MKNHNDVQYLNVRNVFRANSIHSTHCIYNQHYSTGIRTQKDYQHSIEIITALQELIDIEEEKIANYFRAKKV